MAAVTIFALISYVVMPEEAWLPRNRISHFIDSKGVGVAETVEEIHGRGRESDVDADGEVEGEGQGPSGSR